MSAYTDADVVAGIGMYRPGDALSRLHASPETAYVVADYPYGFKLRTEMRCWYEHDAKKGTRFVTQTRNPKTGRWNAPKKSTYSLAHVEVFGADGRLVCDALSAYDTDKAAAYLQRHEKHLHEDTIDNLRFAAAYHASMSEAKAAAQDGLSYGTPAYVTAHKAAVLAGAKAVKAA